MNTRSVLTKPFICFKKDIDAEDVVNIFKIHFPPNSFKGRITSDFIGFHICCFISIHCFTCIIKAARRSMRLGGTFVEG